MRLLLDTNVLVYFLYSPQVVGNMFRRICNPPKFTIRICNPLKLRIYKNMYIYERIANPQLRTAGLQIRRNKARNDRYQPTA